MEADVTNKEAHVKKIAGQVRQGDVLIHPVSEIPAGAKKVSPKGRLVLAEGEVTGHAHVIEDLEGIDVYEKDGVLYMKALAPRPMVHEEHGAVVVHPERALERRIAQEWSDDDEPRQVLD